MTFGTDMLRIVNKTNLSMDVFTRATILKLGKKLDTRSPVGDPKYWSPNTPVPEGYVGGRFRANWQYGFGSAPTGTIDAIDAGGSATQARITAGVMASPTVGLHYLVNNLDYAKDIENGTGSPRQAPKGVVALSVLEMSA